MPSHYGSGGAGGKKTGGKKKTNAQRLKEHSKHHTKKHMQFMYNSMRRGASFSKAHVNAQKKVGK